jgi:hypothetical protein
MPTRSEIEGKLRELDWEPRLDGSWRPLQHIGLRIMFKNDDIRVEKPCAIAMAWVLAKRCPVTAALIGETGIHVGNFLVKKLG